MKRIVMFVAVLTSFAVVPVATADRVYHSEHIELAPVGAAPLRSGFVENIHPNGPEVYAHEIYVLNGALPNTQYVVTLLIFAPGCSGAPLAAIPTATFTTNDAGNGRADFKLTPAEAAPLRGATLGVKWVVASASSAYETACTTVTLD